MIVSAPDEMGLFACVVSHPFTREKGERIGHGSFVGIL